MPSALPLWRVIARMLVAIVATCVVSAGLLVGFAALALAVEWEIPEPTELLGPSEVVDRQGRPLMRLAAHVERRPVDLDQISVHLVNAVVAAEDHRFYEHQGVDPLSVLRAVNSNVREGGIREGGSTLTQQYVKNAFVGSDQTFERKVREALVSLQLEKQLTKDEIVEAYLNRVYFGDGAYGAEAAALTYFDKPASDLTIGEAATLAGVLASPSQRSPRVDPEGAAMRRDRVIDQMARHGSITVAQAIHAKAAPTTIVPRHREPSPAPFYSEHVRRQLVATYGEELVYNGGLTIRSSIDLDVQRRLEEAVAAHVPEDTRFSPAVAVVDPATGDVVATWSGRDFAHSQVDLVLRQSSGQPSGSTFKTFALAAALEQGMELGTTYPSPPQVQIGDWSVRGANGCVSPCSLLEATVRSSNTAYAQIARDLGAAAFTDVARRMGVAAPMSTDDITQVLGTTSVTPLDIASGFATLANDGVACPARAVIEVRDHEDRPLEPLPDPRAPSTDEVAAWASHHDELGYDFGEEDLGRCHRALAPSVARSVTVALSEAVARGTGTAAQLDRPVAGKTGTTSESKQVWFGGYTPDWSIAVAVFAVDAQVPLTDLPGCTRACYGGQLPAQIFHDVALALHDGMPPRPFAEPGEDERTLPDRRRLGPPATRPDPEPEPEPEPEAEPELEPEAQDGDSGDDSPSDSDDEPAEPVDPDEDEADPPTDGGDDQPDDGGGDQDEDTGVGGGILPWLPGPGSGDDDGDADA